jgi:hypothetical protein
MTNHEPIRELLKQAFPPVDAEPRHDLWPAVLRRLDERPRALPWYDWALAALLLGALMFFPNFIPVLLYHL